MKLRRGFIIRLRVPTLNFRRNNPFLRHRSKPTFFTIYPKSPALPTLPIPTRIHHFRTHLVFFQIRAFNFFFIIIKKCPRVQFRLPIGTSVQSPFLFSVYLLLFLSTLL
jgi:hypothetical protein